jgi:hypothetical protein
MRALLALSGAAFAASVACFVAAFTTTSVDVGWITAYFDAFAGMGFAGLGVTLLVIAWTARQRKT